eukprot:gnl/Trimastix_PCT/2088.p1 GENE.gnl/Trimastix_PCT/2088~~gnl/Trimastix_PCT/2088.p1  ORF type:complete len:304 (+),score=46.78 gnl/Trimastix_PCT/2088:106-1017(+)
MGGGYYDRDIEEAEHHIEFRARQAASGSATEPHADTNPLDRTIVSFHQNPVIVALDVTGSMGEWAKIIWAKLPMFYGQLLMQGYLEEPGLMFAGVADAYDCQRPLQVTEFAQGSEIDCQLSKMCTFLSGGGNNRESYALACWYFLSRIQFPNLEPGTKPYLFLTGDEGLFDEVLVDHIRSFYGVEGIPEANVKTEDLFRQMRDKFEIFLLHKNYGTSTSASNLAFNERVKAQWVRMLGEERILHLDDPKACVDTMLGAIALSRGRRTLDRYAVDMTDRGQTSERLEEVQRALQSLSSHQQGQA